MPNFNAAIMQRIQLSQLRSIRLKFVTQIDVNKRDIFVEL